MVPLVLSKINFQAKKKKALKVEAIMEEHPHIIERVHLYIQPNSLCIDRNEYISRAAITAISDVTSSVKKFYFSPTFMATLLTYSGRVDMTVSEKLCT